MGLSIIIPTAKPNCLTLKGLGALDDMHEIILVKAKGLAQARNQGARTARGELIVMFDDDLQLKEGFWKFLKTIEHGQFFMAKVYDNISTRVFAIYAEDFWRVGGFDESIKYIFEDGDFMIRALKTGMKLRIVPDKFFHHIPHLPRQRNKWLLCLLTWEYVRLLLKHKRLVARKGFIRFFLEPFDYRVFPFHFVTKLFAVPYWLLRGYMKC